LWRDYATSGNLEIGSNPVRVASLVILGGEAKCIILSHNIETLLRDWYIARHEKEQRLKKIVAVAEEKKQPKDAKIH
jgi:hypothetical protein